MSYLGRSSRRGSRKEAFSRQPKPEEDGEEPVYQFSARSICNKMTPYIFSKGMTPE